MATASLSAAHRCIPVRLRLSGHHLTGLLGRQAEGTSERTVWATGHNYAERLSLPPSLTLTRSLNLVAVGVCGRILLSTEESSQPLLVLSACARVSVRLVSGRSHGCRRLVGASLSCCWGDESFCLRKLRIKRQPRPAAHLCARILIVCLYCTFQQVYFRSSPRPL